VEVSLTGKDNDAPRPDHHTASYDGQPYARLCERCSEMVVDLICFRVSEGTQRVARTVLSYSAQNCPVCSLMLVNTENYKGDLDIGSFSKEVYDYSGWTYWTLSPSIFDVSDYMNLGPYYESHPWAGTDAGHCLRPMQFVDGVPVSEDPCDFTSMFRAYQACLQHENCTRNSQGIWPARLLYLDSSQFPPANTISLVPVHSRPKPYVALSYCWGGSQSLILKLDNISRLTQGIPSQAFLGCFRTQLPWYVLLAWNTCGLMLYVLYKQSPMAAKTGLPNPPRWTVSTVAPPLRSRRTLLLLPRTVCLPGTQGGLYACGSPVYRRIMANKHSALL